MKNLICLCFVLSLLSSMAFAESSKLTKVDLDVKTTRIVKADLGRDDLFYYMDLTACVCWISQSMGSSFAVSTFDCSKLALHPRLEKYVAECGNVKKDENSKKDAPKEEAPVIKTEAVKKDEVRDEEVKQPEATPVATEDKDKNTSSDKPTKKEGKKSKK
jgi:hypothetical protein